MLFSCDPRRDIITEKNIWVRVEIDWTKAGISPNGATVIFFPKTAGEDPVVLFTNQTVDSVKLVKGDYSIIVFNERVNDHDFISFRGVDQYDTFEAYVNPKTIQGVDGPAGESPDMLAAENRDLFSITYEMVEADKTIKLKFAPERLVWTMIVRAHIQKLYNASKQGNGLIVNGMAEGVNLSTGMITSHPVAHYATMDNIEFYPGNSNDGTMTAVLPTFGVATDAQGQQDCTVTLLIKLRNGKDFPSVTYKVNSLLVWNRPIYQISVDLKSCEDKTVILPEVPIGGGGFDVGVIDWGEVIEIEAPVY